MLGNTALSSLTAAGTFSVADQAGNATTTTAGSPAIGHVDRQGPTLTGGGQSATPTSNPALSFTISGNENITCSTITAADLTLTNATFTSSAQTTASLCTVALTSTIGAGASGTSSAAIAGGFSVTDTAGNAATTASGFPLTWTVDRANPITASVTSPTNGSVLRAATVPASFAGSAADILNGVGLNANSTTFTLRRPNGDYWTGSAWQAGVFNLATTHLATTSNTAATWTSGATLPTWASEADGTYTVQATATDKVGNTLTGTAVTFTLDNTAPTLTGGGQSATPTSNPALSFTISGNENITCSTITAADLTLTNATFTSSAQTTASLCTVALTSTIGAGASGTSTAAIAGGFSVTDTAGNAATTASGFPLTWTVDRQGPTLTGGGQSAPRPATRPSRSPSAATRTSPARRSRPQTSRSPTPRSRARPRRRPVCARSP